MEFILVVLAAFGGGVLATAWGSIVAFAFTGILAMAGLVAGNDAVVGLAFGPLFGPHVAFAGAVAALAYAQKAKIAPADYNVTIPLAGLGNPSVYLVGGIFGVIGYLIHEGVVMVLGGLNGFDTIALTVVISDTIVRFAFGSSGLMGRNASSRKFFPAGNELTVEVLMGLALGAIAGHVAWTTGLGSLPFALSAASLIFLVTGNGVPGTHHITNCAACATMISGGNIFLGIGFGLIAALLGNVYGRLFNSDVDTHIDPPACTIATCTLILALIFPG